MRFKRLLGAVWTIATIVALAITLYERIGYQGYVTKLEPAPVWVIEAIVFFLVLWLAGILIFRLAAAVIRAI